MPRGQARLPPGVRDLPDILQVVAQARAGTAAGVAQHGDPLDEARGGLVEAGDPEGDPIAQQQVGAGLVARLLLGVETGGGQRAAAGPAEVEGGAHRAGGPADALAVGGAQLERHRPVAHNHRGAGHRHQDRVVVGGSLRAHPARQEPVPPEPDRREQAPAGGAAGTARGADGQGGIHVGPVVQDRVLAGEREVGPVPAAGQVVHRPQSERGPHRAPLRRAQRRVGGGGDRGPVLRDAAEPVAVEPDRRGVGPAIGGEQLEGAADGVLQHRLVGAAPGAARGHAGIGEQRAGRRIRGVAGDAAQPGEDPSRPDVAQGAVRADEPA